jgi:phosphoglucosamine mutase
MTIREKMKQSYEVLQGTDGIRGRVAESIPYDEKSALAYYLKTGLLTPEFFQLYTYSYGKLLIVLGYAQENDTIVIGWDPRDSSGKFNEAAISGLLKSGLNVIKIGILPTPAIPIYMLYTAAVGSVVLTASHNPSDQNGIKLFHGYTGLKFLPFDDDLLSQKIYENQDFQIDRLNEKGNLEDQTEKAKTFFIDFCRNPQNSWIKDTSFKDSILVVDASKGATAEVVADIFEGYDFNDLILTNLKGNINENCGVADLEGRERIQEKEVLHTSGAFNQYETLQKLFETAKTVLSVQTGEIKLIGLVFDGDGDRCYRLDYLPFENELMISSGDYLGIHQAIYLMKDFPTRHSTFINTVESDLNTAIMAQDLGYQTIITGVGDKWILRNAIADFIGSHIDHKKVQNQEIAKHVLALKEDEAASGFKISQLWKDYLKQQAPVQKMEQMNFRIGIEESGHSITPGVFQKGDQNYVCFAGNGIKSGLNTLFAIKENDQTSTYNWFDHLKAPFSTGINKTFYVYYVDKTKILPDTNFRKQLLRFLQDCAKKMLDDSLTYEIVEFPEEKPLIYCRILKENRVVGAIFIRNSGTEDKSALYLRGKNEYLDILMNIGHPVHMYMMENLKNPENEFSTLEKHILMGIKSGQSREQILKHFSDFPIERILKEIEFKEHLLERKKGQVLLSQKGEDYLAYAKKSC